MEIAFVHGRPGPHPFHRLLAESVDSDFIFVDYKMRWHDRETSRTYRYLSMAVCAFLFPRNYDVIISEGPHAIPVVARFFKIGRKRAKAVALLDNESLYFLKSGFYPPRTHSRLIRLLNKYDALVCVGDYQFELAEELLGKNNGKSRPALYKIHSSIKGDRIALFGEVTPNFGARKLLFIGNGPSGWRSYYKGLDILLDALQVVAKELPDIFLTIVGEWEDDHVNELLKSRQEIKSKVRFAGKVSDLGPFFADSDLYVHPARGEAFGITIIEAMCAGVPCVVSDQTGAKEAVLQVSREMVTGADPASVAEQILKYFGASVEEKKRLSRLSRTVANEYLEERSIYEFRSAIGAIAGI